MAVNRVVITLRAFYSGGKISPRCKFTEGIQMSIKHGYKNPFAQKVSQRSALVSSEE
jgi:hypothetical protein